MKLKVGETKFGEISDESVRPSRVRIRHEMVDDLLIDGVVRLIKLYQWRYGTDDTIAREKFMRAMGLTPDGQCVKRGRKRNGKRTEPKRST